MSGLDPKENRQERERKKAEENKPPPLNPPFPFRVVAFDPWTYGLQNDPSPIDTAPPTAQ
jgi:hypothetical protein